MELHAASPYASKVTLHEKAFQDDPFRKPVVIKIYRFTCYSFKFTNSDPVLMGSVQAYEWTHVLLGLNAGKYVWRDDMSISCIASLRYLYCVFYTFNMEEAWTMAPQSLEINQFHWGWITDPRKKCDSVFALDTSSTFLRRLYMIYSWESEISDTPF